MNKVDGINYHLPLVSSSLNHLPPTKELSVTLDALPKEQQSLINHSLLHGPAPLPSFSSDPEMRAKLFAHIHDLPVQGTQLEGFVFTEICAYLNQVLSFLRINLSYQFMAELEQLKRYSQVSASFKNKSALKRIAKNWTEDVTELKWGESLSFPAMWTASHDGSHAMILCFKKRSDNSNYDITLYQTASSAQQAYVIIAGKRYQQPSIFAKNVSKKELFFDEEDERKTAFFEQLLSFQHPPSPEKQGSFCLQTFLTVFHNFKEKIEVYEENRPLVLVQRGGFCAFKVFLARLQAQMEVEYLGYKPFIDQLKFTTLIQYYRDSERLLPASNPLGSQARGLLKKATQDYCLHLTKMIDQISDHVYQTRYGTVLDILHRLAHLEEQLKQQKLVQFRYFPLYLLSQQPPINNVPTKMGLRSPPEVSRRPYSNDPLLPHSTTRFKEALESFLALKASAGNNDLRPLLFMDNLLLTLPLEKSFWSHLPFAECQSTFTELNNLFDYYLNNFLVFGRPLPAQVNTLINFYIILHLLALVIDNAKKDLPAPGNFCRLSDYTLSFPFNFFKLDNDMACLDKSVFERRQILLKQAKVYFLESDTSLFHTPAWHFDGDNLETHREIRYGLALLNHCPKLNESFDSSNWQGDWLKEVPWRLELKKAFCLTFEDEGKIGLKALKENGFDYLIVLKKVAALLHQLSNPTLADEKTPFQIQIYHSHTRNSFDLKASFHLKKGALAEMPEGELVSFMQNPYGRQRFIPHLKSEGEILMEHNKLEKWLREMRSGSSPALQPYLLLNIFSNEIGKLADASYQGLFEYLFFKDVGDHLEHSAFPLVDELLNQPSLSLLCWEFVSKGLDEFYLLQPNRRPNVPACLFFIRLSQRIGTLAPHVNPDAKRHLELMLTWLQEVPNLTEAEKKAIHLHCLAYYLRHNPTLDLLAHWLHFHHLQWGTTSLDYFPYQYEIEKLYYSFQPQLKALLKQPEAAAKVRNILRAFVSGTSLERSQGSFTSDFTYCLKTNGKQFCEIHLPTGTIYTEEGPLTLSTHKNLTASKNYQRIFSDKKLLTCTLKGDTLYFREEPLGAIRTFDLGWGDYEFQRQDEERVWWHFVPAETLKESIPWAILADHTHWVHPSRDKIMIRRKTDDKLIAFVSGGKLTYFAPEEAELFLLPANFQEAINVFERSQYVLFYRTAQSSFLTFPRLKSLLGEALEFKKEGDVFVWQQDPAYLLEEKQKAVMLGVPNYLTLRHRETNRYKIVVPCHPIKTVTPFSDDHKLVEDEAKTSLNNSTPVNELDVSQAGSLTYLVFDVADGQPLSSQTEGILFLAYIALAKRNYLHARRLIQKLPIYLPLSAVSKKIVDRLIRSGKSLQDASPNAILLRALVWHWSRRCLNPCHKNYSEDQKLLEQHKSVLQEHLSTYFLGRNHLELGLYMTAEEERLLADPRDPLYSSCLDTAFNRSCSITIPNYSPAPLMKPSSYMVSHFSIEDSNEPLPLPMQCTEEGFNLRYIHLLNQALHGAEPVKKHLAWWLANFIQNHSSNHAINTLVFTLRLALENPTQIGKLPQWANLVERGQFFERVLTYKNVDRKAVQPSKKIYLPKIQSPFQHLPQTKNKKRLELKIKPSDHFSTGVLTKNAFKKVDSEISPYPNIALSRPKLTDEELLCKKAIETEFQQFDAELKAGEAYFSTKTSFQLKMEISQLTNELRMLERRARDDLEALESKILHFFAYSTAESNVSKRVGNLLQSANIIPALDPTEVPFLFLYAKYDLFRRFNPSLSDEEIEEVYHLIGHSLILKYRAQKIGRALILCDKIKRASDSSVKEEHVQDLFEVLNTDLNFDPNLYPEYLVVNTLANIQLNDKVIACLNAARKRSPTGYLSGIFQLPPGAGKTSQIETMLAYLATTFKGRLAALMVPKHLLATIVANFERSQQDRFGQKIIVFDMPSQKFTLDVLIWMDESIKNAMSEGHLVITTPDFVHFLGLELDICLAQENAMSKARFELLQSILSTFMNKKDLIPDEVEQDYTVFKETNIPTSAERPIDLPYLDLVYTIYEALISEALLPGVQKSVQAYAKLLTNQQPQILLQDYKTHILPYLANYVFERHNELLIKAEFIGDFLNYVQGRTHISEPFLAELERLFRSSDPKEKLAANLIAVTKHLLSTVLPKVTLKQKGNHDYVRSKIRIGTVVHGSIDNPLETLFAWTEAMANSCQIALNEGIKAAQIQAWGSHLIIDAEFFAKKEHIPLDETIEAKTFHRLTGIAIRDYKDPVKLQEAARHVNLSPVKILEVEREMMSYSLGYYEKRFNSNPSTLVQFSDTVRGFSATATLMPYSEKMASLQAFDQGLLGQIGWELLRQEKTKAKFIHFVQRSDDVSHFLESTITGHPQAKNIRGIIDPIGLLKRPALEMAQEILKFFAKEPHIQAVLFYNGNQLMMWKKGADAPLGVRGTEWETYIEPLGIPLENLFYFYDFNHCSSIHLLQPNHAIFLLTVDGSMTMTTFSQAAGRLGRNFYRKEIEIVLHEGAQEAFETLNLMGLFKRMLINQGQKKGQAVHRHAIHEILELPKKPIQKKLLTLGYKEAQNLFEQERSRFEMVATADPFVQFGAVESPVILTDHLRSFAQLAKVQEVESLIQQAAKHPSSPDFVLSTPQAALSSNMQLEMMLQQEVQTQMEHELALDLQKELDFYLGFNSHKLRAEDTEEISHLLLSEKSTKRSLKELLNPQTAFPYQAPFADLFDPHLYVTQNFSLTTVFLLPVFHPTQKPMEQLFIRFNYKEGTLEAFALSLNEATVCKRYLHKRNYEGWLMLSDGTLLEHNPHYKVPHDGPFSKQLERVLIQANLFNAEITYLDQHLDHFKEIYHTPEKMALAKRWLMLKVQNNRLARQRFYKSDLFYTIDPKSFTERPLSRERRLSLEQQELAFDKLAPQDFRDLSRRMIAKVPLDKVCHLQGRKQLEFLRPAQIKAVSPLQVPDLSSKQIQYLELMDQIQALTEDQLVFITKEQLPLLKDEQISKIPYALVEHVYSYRWHLLTPEQWRYVPRDRIPLLTNPVAIKAVPLDLVVLLVPLQYPLATDEQLRALEDEDIKSIPDERIPVLRDAQLNHLTTKQIQSITDRRLLWRLPSSKYPFLLPGQLNELLPSHIAAFSAPLLKHLVKPELIQAATLVDHLTSSQCAYITDVQIRALTKKRLIQVLPQDKLALLSLEQLKKLARAQIEAIVDPHLLNRLPPEVVFRLTTKQATQLSPSQMHHLHPAQLNHFSDAELMRLPGPFWSKIPPYRLVQFLQNHYLDIRRSDWGAHLDQLSAAQFNAIPQNFVNYLRPTQIQKLSSRNQIQSIHFRNIYSIDPKVKYDQLSTSQKVKIALHLLVTTIVAVVSLIFVTLAIILAVLTPINQKIWSHLTLPSRNLFFLIRWHLGLDPMA